MPMLISELIVLLERLKESHGDLPVVWESLTHRWPPDPVVRENAAHDKYVLLNS